MPILERPTQNILFHNVEVVYIRADDVTINQYCTENSYTLVSYTPEDQRFSNDGGLAYQYYTGSEWITEFGYSTIVDQLVYS